MVSGANQNYINAYREILENISSDQVLVEKIKSGKNLIHQDISMIARSVFVREVNGSVHVEKNIAQNHLTFNQVNRQTTLIKEIIEHGKEHPASSVAIVRKKRKQEDDDCSDQSIKKQKKEAPESLESKVERASEFFRLAKYKKNAEVSIQATETPTQVLQAIAEFMDETNAAVVDFAFGLQELPLYMKTLRSLDLSNARMAPGTISTVVKEFNKLESIKLPGYTTDDDLYALSQACPNLISLDLTGCKNITDDGLDHITAHMRSIQKLNLSGCREIRSIGVNRLLISLENIQELNLSGCNKVSDLAFENVKDRHIYDLNLSGTSITDNGLNLISDDINCIKKIVLADCKSITDEGVSNLIQKLEKLEYLDLSCSNISDVGLTTLNQRTGTLRTLNLGGTAITGEFLSEITDKFAVLRELSFANCRKLDTDNLDNLSNKLPSLVNLELIMVVRCDIAIEHLVQGSANLEEVDLSSTRVGNDGLQILADNCPNLKILYINNCINFTELGLKAIAEKCSNLEELHLFMSSVNDDGIETIAQHCHKLKKLTLTNTKVTNKAMDSISRGCPDLKFIDLVACDISDAGILSLTQNVHDLRELNASNCCKITSESLKHISNSRFRETIQRLELKNAEITLSDYFIELSPGLPNLMELHIVSNNITDEVTDNIVQYFPNIEKLELACCSITDDCLRRLSRLSKLKSIAFDTCDTMTDAGLEHLIEFPSLNTFSIKMCDDITNLQHTVRKLVGTGMLQHK